MVVEPMHGGVRVAAGQADETRVTFLPGKYGVFSFSFKTHFKIIPPIVWDTHRYRPVYEFLIFPLLSFSPNPQLKRKKVN